MKKRKERAAAFCLAFVLLLTSVTVSAEASKEPEVNAADLTDSNSSTMGSSASSFGYRTYISSLLEWMPAETDLNAVIQSGNQKDIGDQISFSVTAPSDGLYGLKMSYKSLSTQNIVLSVEIDGCILFSESERLSFPVNWINENNEWVSQSGNQFTPEQILYTDTVTAIAQDYSGRFEDPYWFGLTSGEHTVTITVKQGSFELIALSFTAPEQVSAYVKPESMPEVSAADPIILEGEAATIKNDRALIPLSDAASAAVTPCDPVYSKLNYIGGSNWKTPGSSLTWEYTVETAGYYYIGFHCRQNQLLGGIAYRHLTIDGKTPFAEAKRMKFTYDSTWKHMVFGKSEEEPYLIYLDEGPHTLTMTVTAGDIADIYASLQEITASMGDLYVDITKIVGETVDVYRSYELFNQIPQFNDRLNAAISSLNALADDMESLQESDSGSSVSIVRDAVRVIQQMVDNPYSAHRYKSQFYDAYTNLSALMTDMVNMPLDIDQLILVPYGSDYKLNSVSWFKKTVFAFRRFIETFMNDYNTISGNSTTGEALTIWVNWGRDQAEAFNAIIQEGFVQEYGVGVNVSLVNASLIQAILAGAGPDCLVQMARTEPVNLAMRGALVDLKQFEDYDEVITRFSDGADVPYAYKDGVYALPVSQSFFMMFARTDILQSMDLQIPETWDEFIETAGILQRSNLQVSLPYTQIADSGTVNSGVGGLTLYPTLLLQNGLDIYNETRTGTALSNVEQTQLFVNWIEWYTKYKIPVITSFYNRFRIGSAPLGIAPYTLYTELKAAAPEIDGRWTITALPGTVREDGSIDRTSAGSGTGCSITQLSENPENAWLFLKWWTSAKTQLKYSNMLESVLGPLGRAATANTEALKGMDWDADMIGAILEQQQNTTEIAEIPGGYYTARGIDQAYWGVVEMGRDSTEMIEKWAKVVDLEITRKKQEYEN